MAQISLTDTLEQASDAAWQAHPRFAGVMMKTLISGALTGGALSQHLVRVAPHCALEPHVHPTQCELHLVIAGQATANLATQTLEYVPGRLATLPAGMEHAVYAGADGITLLASFSPAQA